MIGMTEEFVREAICKFCEHFSSQLKESFPLPNDHQIASFYRHLELVLAWNKKLNLISAKTNLELVENHLLDSLALALVIKKFITNDSEEILDVGSGNGFPGIVLASVLKNPVHLCEVREKRAMFLKEVRRELGLENVKVHCCKMEDLKADDFSNLKFTTARALGMHDIFRNESLRLFSRRNGYIVEMAGPNYIQPHGQLKVTNMFNFTLSKDNKSRSLVFLKCFT